MSWPDHTWNKFERGAAHLARTVKWTCEKCGVSVLKFADTCLCKCTPCNKWMKWEPAEELESGVKS